MFALAKALIAVALLAPAPNAGPSAPAPSAPTRPDWTNGKEGLVDEGYQKVILVGPYSTDVECDREIPVKLVEATVDYVGSYNTRLGPQLRITADMLRYEQRHLVRDVHRETINSSVGPMRQIHMRLVFDRKFNSWLDQKLAEIVVARRVNALAIAGAAVIGALAVALVVVRRTTPPSAPADGS